MNEQYSALRSNVSMLGKVLGETIKDALGEHILERVETIRKLSKSSRAGNDANRQELLTTLQNLSNDELLPVARAFSQFLNLANTAEQYHSISPKGEAASNPEVIARTLRKLKNQPELSEDTIKKAVESLSLELVLTAHPTEITRRTLIHKMVEVNACLKQLDNKDIADYEHNQLMRRLRQLIAQSWHTDEIRKLRPSPVDEAKWGFAVVENSLWQGVPNYLRELNEQLEENLGYKLPVEFVPVRFTSWMGGDRDGNPNVTADITRHVLLLSRWKATDLFLKDIQVLVSELSMVEATPELLALVGEEGAAETVSLSDEKPAFSPDGDTGMAGSAPERRRTAKTRRAADTKRRTVGTALRLLPVTSGVWHGYYRQRRSARHPAPREMFRRTAGPY